MFLNIYRNYIHFIHFVLCFIHASCRMQINLLSRFQKLLPYIIVGIVVAIFCLGILVPIYSDEIAVHMARSRFFLDRGLLINLFPQCNNSLTANIPFTWYPAAIFFGVIYGIPYSILGGLGLRLMGIILGLCWLSVLWFWGGKLVQGTSAKMAVRALLISFNGLGVLPFVLILARSEQILLLCLALYCLFSLFWKTRDFENNGTKALKIIAFMALTSVFFYAHPKAIFFFPFIIVSAFLIFKKENTYIKLLIAAFIGLATYQGLQQARGISSECHNAPLLARALGNNTLDLHQFSENHILFFQHASENLLFSLGQVLDKIPFSSSYQSGWLPSEKNQKIGTVIQNFGNVLRQSLLLFFVGLICVFVIQIKRQILYGNIRPQTALASMLVFGLAIHAIIYNVNSWHFYTPGLIIPAFLLLFLLLLPINLKLNGKWALVGRGFIIYWTSLAFISIGILLYLTLPQLIEIAQEDKYVIPNQSISTPIFLGEKRRDELLSLAHKCDIDPARSERLVVDGVAYLELKNQRTPINALYVSDYGFGMDVSHNLRAYLALMNSDGILSRCDYLPEMLRKNAITSGSMCCISRHDLQK